MKNFIVTEDSGKTESPQVFLGGEVLVGFLLPMLEMPSSRSTYFLYAGTQRANPGLQRHTWLKRLMQQDWLRGECSSQRRWQ